MDRACRTPIHLTRISLPELNMSLPRKDLMEALKKQKNFEHKPTHASSIKTSVTLKLSRIWQRVALQERACDVWCAVPMKFATHYQNNEKMNSSWNTQCK
uniref:(northern house mosquito) hypothetical protein n=1 Tax=Culex pipiens TaxID=7175 RepID=A0A8D8NHT5_CULPI